MATKLGDLLEGAVERAGAADQVLAVRVLDYTASVLREFFGDAADQYLQPRSFRHGAISLTVAAPAASLEVRRREHELLQRLRRRFPRVRIERLQLLPGEVGPTSDGGR
ncbi:MAG: DUF721 domain-containing protein [Candidatus Kerfeldbacteria bacterium]|nr:DUF721 domain-containing protein [Candidatus Kerfeldbacteria bacterium]